MTDQELRDYFGPIGSSWKQHGGKFTSASGRRLLGRKGQGRVGAFAIGPRTEWTTVSREADGRLLKKSFTWRDDVDEFDFTTESVREGTTGTSVTITDVSPSAERISSDHELHVVGQALAVYLLKYPRVRVWIDGTELVPDAFINRRTKLSVPIGPAKVEDPDLLEDLSGASAAADVEVLEWRIPVKRELLCFDADPAGTSDVVFVLPARVRATGISFSAILRWDGVPALAATADADELSPAVHAMKREIEGALRTHLRRRSEENRLELLNQWKTEGTYPYSTSEPTDSSAERDLFDLVAVAASPAFAQSDKKTRVFALEMLKATIQSDAGALRRVLEKVFDLDESHLNDIDELLQRTSLVSMIEISKEVADRVRFVDWLESILADDEWVRRLRERGGLQAIIEQNVWVFGDQWQTLLADRGLRTAAVQASGVDDPTGATSTDDAAILDSDGRIVRVDLLLARSMRAAGRRQYLVIELKRPSRTISKDDLGQIENYYDTIINSPQFDDGRIDWTFILVGRKFDDSVNRRRSQADRPQGLVDTQKLDNGATYKLWVHSWAEIIEDARARLAFVREHLSEVPSDEDLQALSDAHRHLLGLDSVELDLASSTVLPT